MRESIVAEIGFNRDDDDKDYGAGERIVHLQDEDNFMKFHFNLGRRSDDTITLTFNRQELLSKLLEL